MNKRLLGAVCGALLIAGFSYGEEPATQPTTQMSPQAGELLKRIDSAYSKLHSLQLAGVVTGDFDVAGISKGEKLSFTSSFREPNCFTHIAKDDVSLVSTGEKVYAYQPSRNAYLTTDAPKEKGDLNDWPKAVGQILQDQNPSLLLALTKSAGGNLQEMSDEMTCGPDVAMDGVNYQSLQFELPDHREVTMLVDPKTSLLRQVKFDLKKLMTGRGAVDVKTAAITVDYTTITTDAVKDEQFAWTPPANAIAIANSTAAGQSLSEGSDADSLVGKPAPALTLNGLDDKPVTLTKLKGSVVVLDFWALWCGPCVASLPGLDAFNQELAPKGLKVFAVNLQDDKEKIQTFVKTKNLTLPILLDVNGDVASAFLANAIPEKVLIGKDGIVKKVFIGADPKTEEDFHAAVRKEMGL